MSYAIVESFKFKDQDIRFAFNNDDTFIFIEDAEKLHKDFSVKRLADRMNPEDIINIIVKEPGKDPQEHIVASVSGSEMIYFCSHWEGTDTYWEIHHWLYGVKNTNSEYRKFCRDNADAYSNSEFRKKILEHACTFKNLAEQMVLKERFFIDTMSKAHDEETTFECLDTAPVPEAPWVHMDNANQKEAPNEAPIA